MIPDITFDSRLILCNSSGKVTGESELYSLVHSQGLWHKSARVWVISEINEFLVQKRSDLVDIYPGLYEATAGGHIEEGHSSIETAQLELKEETGIYLPTSEFSYLFTIKDSFHIPQINVLNNEYDDVYLVKVDSKIKFKKDDSEVSELTWFPAKEYLERGIKGDPQIVPRKEEYELLYKFLEFS